MDVYFDSNPGDKSNKVTMRKTQIGNSSMNVRMSAADLDLSDMPQPTVNSGS